MKKWVSIFFLLFCLQNSYAQHFELGGEFGYGKATLNHGSYYRDLFGEYSENNFNIGIIGSFNPKTTVLFFNTGLFYQQKADNESLLNYFKIPLGINIEPGKKFRVMFGGGFYLSYLFLTSGYVNPDLASSKNDFQVGAYADIGFKYQIATSWNIFVKMQLDFDLSALYKQSIPQHYGATVYQNIKSYDYLINIGFNYLMPARKKTN
jgi:hypothetical protein